MNISSLYKVFTTNEINYLEDSDLYIAAKQISIELMTSKELVIDDSLSYLNEEDIENIIYLDDERIVKKPGFEIFAFDVEMLDFKIEDELVYMIVGRKDKEYKFLIGSYIDDYFKQEG